MADMALIVPSPMTKRVGRRKSDGELSEHTLDATGGRRFFVAEFDQGDVDSQAAKIWRLQKQYAPLVLVAHSGGKSLHSWFYCGDQPKGRVSKFMSRAFALGADRATKTRSQFVRIPGGARDGSIRQEIYFFNPKVLP